MTPWLEKLFASSTTHALRLNAQFSSARHNLLADNIANIDTPDYRSRSLDAERFQTKLAEALDRAKASDVERLELRDEAQFSTDRHGLLQVKPTEEPPPNTLFHDGSNARIETLVSDLQSNAMQHRLTLNLLKGRFDGMLNAIRGRMQ